MDALDELLLGVKAEQPPREALERVLPGVEGRLRRRAMGRYAFVAAAVVAGAMALWPWPEADVALPEPIRPVIAVPDLILSRPAPVEVSRRRAKPKARMLDEHTVELASSDERVVIYWSL